MLFLIITDTYNVKHGYVFETGTTDDIFQTDFALLQIQ